MKNLLLSILFITIGLQAGDEGISPRQLTVDLPKKCEILRLHTEPDEKSKTMFTTASYGTVVENMGCIRNITQKELDETPEKKRYYLAFKNPVWCKVAVGKKKGWVLQKYLKNESLEFDEEDDD
jgi:hypothetical protein